MRRMASRNSTGLKSATLGQVVVVCTSLGALRLRLLGFFLLKGQSGTISVP